MSDHDDIALKCRFWDQWTPAECKLVADEYMAQHEHIAKLERALAQAEAALRHLVNLIGIVVPTPAIPEHTERVLKAIYEAHAALARIKEMNK